MKLYAKALLTLAILLGCGCSRPPAGNADSANDAVGRVNELNQARKFQEAIDLATASLKTFPGNFSLLANRATSYQAMEKPQAAIADFSAALPLAPAESRWAILSQRARCEASLDQKAQAEKDFAAAVDGLPPGADPGLAEQLWRFRGMNLLSDLRAKESIPCFDQSLKLKPDQAKALVGRAMAYSALKDRVHFDADMKALKALNPDAAQKVEAELAHEAEASTGPAGEAEKEGMAGTLKLRDGDNQGAITHFTRAIALSPRSAQAYQKRGSALQNLGKLDEAIADYTRSYDIDHNEVALYNRAVCYLTQHKEKPARADFEEFVKIGKDATALQRASMALKALPK